MPTYRSLTLSLISQFDVLTIPEYAPPSTPADPFTDSSSAPTLVNSSTALVSVYIPTYPSSQFWLSYSVSPPYPPDLLYYFKLYVNGNCIVSWGCGEEDGYKGKTIFGLYASPGCQGIERRVLAFGPPTDGRDPMPGSLDDVMEVRVYRSKGRKRVVPEVKEYQSVGMQSRASGSKKVAPIYRGNGIDLVNAGFLRQKHPQRYYKYALLDPLDRPFSTFRYYYRTWDQLEALGVISPTPSVESSSIQTSPVEREASPKNSIETTRSLDTFMDTLNTTVSSCSDLVKDRDHVSILTKPDNDSPTKIPAPMSTVPTTTRAKTTCQYQPGTPPPSSSGPNKTNSIPIATGLILTNLPPNPTPLPYSASSATITPSSSLDSSSLPTKPSLTHQSSKDTFASIIRTHLPSPNPDSFRLTDLSATIEKTSSHSLASWREKAKMEQSMGSSRVLRNVFGRDNLRQTQRRSSSGDSGGSIRSGTSSASIRSVGSGGSEGKGKGAQYVKPDYDDTSSGPKTVEQAVLGQGYDPGSEDHAGGNEKGQGKQKEEKYDSQWARSRSKRGNGRKLNLWEVV